MADWGIQEKHNKPPEYYIYSTSPTIFSLCCRKSLFIDGIYDFQNTGNHSRDLHFLLFPFSKSECVTNVGLKEKDKRVFTSPV